MTNVWHFVRANVSRIVFFVRKSPMAAALVVGALILSAPGVALAQSGGGSSTVAIDFGADDLNIFFQWFNTIFSALLPIALLGAGLTAGGLFVWVIARMLIRAFSNMLNGGNN